jgi:type II secretory pathway component GspD/PulD (secretin)
LFNQRFFFMRRISIRRITLIFLPVLLALLLPPTYAASAQQTGYYVFSGSFKEMANATREVQRLKQYHAAMKVELIAGETWYQVYTGPYANKETAKSRAGLLQKNKVISSYSIRRVEKQSPGMQVLSAQDATSIPAPVQKSEQQDIQPQITSPKPVQAKDPTPAVKSEPALPQLPSAQQTSPGAPVQTSSGTTAGISIPPAQVQQSMAAPAFLPRRGLFTLNFDDADVYTVIQTIFGEILNANYVVDPRVKGRVTFRAVTPVPAESVLPLMEVILRLNGIGIVEDGGLYRIVPISDISKEPSPISYGRDPARIVTTGRALLQVVPILYIKSSEALKLITPFASNNAVLIDVPKGNQLIIVDTDASVKRLLKLIEVFDNEKLRQTKQQVFVYQVQNSKAKDTASVLQQIFLSAKGSTADQASVYSRTGAGAPAAAASAAPGAAVSSHPQVSTISTGGETLVSDFTKIIADEITNTIIILSTPEDYAAIIKTIEKLDIVPRQVVIEAMIASVSLTDNLSLGISGLISGKLFGLSSTVALNPGELSVNPAKISQPGLTYVGTDSGGVVKAYITALATDSKAKVLASPHVLVSDNREAKIQVGQQVPLMTSETYGAAGVTPQRNYQYKDIGIILKVKPRINEGGLVSLEISQEISTYEKIPIGGTDQLLLNKTEASTNLVVQDGQTIIIGGLIREDTAKSKSGIPFLSKIPLLGWLFGNTKDDKQRQELIILLTPHVLKNQKEARELSEEYINNMSVSSEGRIKKEELIKEKPPRIQEGAKPPEVPGNTVRQKP